MEDINRDMIEYLDNLKDFLSEQGYMIIRIGNTNFEYDTLGDEVKIEIVLKKLHKK